MTTTPSPLPNPKTDMVISIATKLAVAGGALLVGRNLLTQDQLNALVGTIPAVFGAAAVIGPVIYGIWKTSRSQKIAATAALPGATVVLSSQDEADKHPSESVVGPTGVPAAPAPSR